MCDYCDMTFINEDRSCDEYLVHKPLYLKDENTRRRIKADWKHPIMFLKEYRRVGIWHLVCKTPDDDTILVETPIIYCPRCGRKLAGFNNETNISNKNSVLIRAKAMFIGTDRSMGFRNGRIYNIRTYIKNNWICLYADNGLWCPYSNMECLLKNWKIIEQKEQL